jgi:hypothetical protein
MTCAACEARREWVRKQYERSKERMRLCIERLTNPVDSKQSAVVQDDGSTESLNGPDRRTEQQFDGSARD